MSSPLALTAFWVLGMLAYAASYYYSDSHKDGAHSFWRWLTQVDVLTTKVIGLVALELWAHSWKTPAVEWFENLLPHRPFSGFVFGFFLRRDRAPSPQDCEAKTWR